MHRDKLNSDERFLARRRVVSNTDFILFQQLSRPNNPGGGVDGHARVPRHRVARLPTLLRTRVLFENATVRGRAWYALVDSSGTRHLNARAHSCGIRRPPHLLILAHLRRWGSTPSGKCSYEWPTRGKVCGTMRSMCSADAGWSTIN